MRVRKMHPASRRGKKAEPLYRSGETVPAGTYVSLDDGCFVRVRAGGSLPVTSDFPQYYMRLSESPDYFVCLSLIAGRA